MPLDAHTLGLFAVAALALNLTPGPDMLFCFANGLAHGRGAGLAAGLGVGAGSFVHVAAAAVGLAGLILASPVAFDLVRYAGAAYLVFIGVQTLRTPPISAATPATASADLRRIFAQGAITNILNPKVALFFIALLPQFVDPARGSVALQVVLLGSLVNVTGTIVNAGVGASAGTVGSYLARNPIVARLQQWITGAIFLGLAFRLALSEGAPARR
jgi:threonine/homoserine/homoserine lactone efflux protein